MNGDTQTQKYLNIAANGTREDLPTDTCCTTKTQKYILDVAERLFNNEEEIAEKQDKLTAGDNITIDPETNVISATGGGSSMPLYTTLGENTDGPITQQTARRAIYGNNGMMAVTIAGQDASSDTQVPAFSTHVGPRARGTGNYGVSIGNSSSSNARMAIAIGASSAAAADSAIALGSGSYATSAGEINVYTGAETDTNGYNGTRLRLIRGLHPGVQDDDAATVGQLNTAVGDIEAALTTLNSGTGV